LIDVPSVKGLKTWRNFEDAQTKHYHVVCPGRIRLKAS
jgi:hypothetical protein